MLVFTSTWRNPMSLRNVVTLPLLVAVADSDQIQSENHQPEAEPGLTALRESDRHAYLLGFPCVTVK